MDESTPEQPTSPQLGLLLATVVTGAIATAIIPLNFWVFSEDGVSLLFVVLAGLQFVLGVSSTVLAIVYYRRARPGMGMRIMTVFAAFFGTAVGLGGPIGLALAYMAESFARGLGGAWGRPLRVRGRVLHPKLRRGSDWTQGAQPSTEGLDAATRRALEALWLHDAQKEHASVPAFSRISWLLAAVGAPAELHEGALRAAMQEIDHTRRCFALAAGYGGRNHSVEAMPDLLLGGLDLDGEPHVHLAIESLNDGCLLEDFNADVAGACVAVCEEPATRDVLERITREERDHAEFSWQLVEWLIARSPKTVVPALERAIEALASIRRPTAAHDEKARLVAAADPAALLAHGRIPDARWAVLWSARVESTRDRAEALLTASRVDEAELAA